MANARSLWWPDDPVDIYQGKVFDRDGRAVWVIRRVHRASGWCVEVHVDDPRSPAISRRWYPGARPARRAVEALRHRIARASIGDVAVGPAEPPPARGVVAAHGLHGRVPESVGVPGEPDSDEAVCTVFWLPPGPSQLSWNRGRPQTVEVLGGGVVHAGGHGFTIPGRLRPVRSSVNWIWRCSLRDLRFEDGALTPWTDLRRR